MPPSETTISGLGRVFSASSPSLNMSLLIKPVTLGFYFLSSGVWQKHYECLLNEKFDWNKESLALNNSTIGQRSEIEVHTVRRVLGRMKCGKASGSFGVVAEILQASGEVGINRMTDFFNGILDEYKIPEEWNTSVILNCFKKKGEATDRGNYRGLKLLEHLMKFFKKVIEEEIRGQVSIDSMLFRFMPGRSTIDAIFITWQLAIEKNCNFLLLT